MRTQPVIFHNSATLASASGSAPAAGVGKLHSKKPFSRRRGDRSQQIRFGVQVSFAAIALWVGVQFIMWVRYFESGGATIRVERPDGVEAWLPIASLMNLKVLILTRSFPEMHVAGMFML